jgi:outer membrane protein OmpA-like peptidoglycan-associated protein
MSLVHLHRIAISVVLCALSATLLSAQAHDMPGSQDHPLISRYSGSVIDEYAAKAYEAYTLPLGKMGQGEIAKSQPLEGKFTRIHYAIPPGRSTMEVLRNYQDALQHAGFQTLFTCALAQCGNGYIEGQTGWCGGCSARHISAKLSRPEGDVYVSLHVEQDNDTTPAWAEIVIVEMKPMDSGLVMVNADSLASDISRTGHASVYGIYFDTGKADVKPESDGTLEEIAKLLQKSAQLKLYVVGHTDNVGNLASNQDLSQRRADAVAQLLSAKYGVLAARLRAIGDGPSAPVASNDSEEGRAKNRRVELVKQ